MSGRARREKTSRQLRRHRLSGNAGRLSTPEQLEQRSMLTGDLEISEFLANNVTGIQDQFDHYSDWVEIHNKSAGSINLGGWHLTDDSADKHKWTFPSISIGSDEFLVVFASGRDLTDTAHPLHTNFTLNTDGEYLALVSPQLVVEHEFTQVPPQEPDVSYGIARSENEASVVPQRVVPLTDGTSTTRIFVPTDTTLATTWDDPNFNDSSWTQITSKSGVGFSQYDPGFAVRRYRRSGLALANLQGAERIIDTPDSEDTLATASPTTINYAEGNPAGGNHFSNELPFPAPQGEGTPNDYVIEVTAQINFDGSAAGDWSFGVRADGAFSLNITDGITSFALAIDPEAAVQDRVGCSSFSEGVYQLRLVKFDATGNSEIELFAAPGSFTSFPQANGAFKLLGNSSLAGITVTSPAVTAHRELADLIAHDVEDAMVDVNPSLYYRRTFSVTAASAYSNLTLRMRYEDGFVAYLNGTEVARSTSAGGTPGTPLPFNATASDRTGTLATILEEFSISNALVNGTNVLAIQGLNSAVGSGDFLLLAELIGLTEATDPVTQDPLPVYFTEPSPDDENPDVGQSRVSDTVIAGALRGFYDAPQSITLSTQTPGATLRYTTDGSLPTVVCGKVHSVRFPPGVSPIAIPFESDLGPLCVEVGLVEIAPA